MRGLDLIIEFGGAIGSGATTKTAKARTVQQAAAKRAVARAPRGEVTI